MKIEDTKEKVQQTIAQLLDIPADLTLDLPKITLIGNIQIIIENHKGLIEFTPNKIIINSNQFPIVLKGQSFVVRSIKLEELIIEGIIESVVFMPV